MNIAFLFPGQGAQYPGMARDLHEHSQAVRLLFEEASDAAGSDLVRLLFEGSDEELKQTDNTQIAITLANLAARAVLHEFGISSSMSAGFSLGEYAALVDTGVLSIADAVRLTMHRGQIMERVSRSLDSVAGAAGMAASMGKDLPEVEAILADAGVEEVYPSLYNSPIQTVVGGTASGLSAAADALKAGGVRRVIPLKVSGPFHTPLMQPARDDFAGHVADVSFSDPAHPLFSNVTGERVETGSAMRNLCLDQLIRTVRWTTEERALHSAGADLLLEVGPGSVLQGLWKAVGKVDGEWPTERVRPAGSLEDIQALAREVADAG